MPHPMVPSLNRDNGLWTNIGNGIQMLVYAAAVVIVITLARGTPTFAELAKERYGLGPDQVYSVTMATSADEVTQAKGTLLLYPGTGTSLGSQTIRVGVVTSDGRFQTVNVLLSSVIFDSYGGLSTSRFTFYGYQPYFSPDTLQDLVRQGLEELRFTLSDEQRAQLGV
jgi:hypothetical protein